MKKLILLSLLIFAYSCTNDFENEFEQVNVKNRTTYNFGDYDFSTSVAPFRWPGEAQIQDFDINVRNPRVYELLYTDLKNMQDCTAKDPELFHVWNHQIISIAVYDSDNGGLPNIIDDLIVSPSEYILIRDSLVSSILIELNSNSNYDAIWSIDDVYYDVLSGNNWQLSFIFVDVTFANY